VLADMEASTNGPGFLRVRPAQPVDSEAGNRPLYLIFENSLKANVVVT